MPTKRETKTKRRDTRRKGEYHPDWAPASGYVEKWINKLVSRGVEVDQATVRSLTKAYYMAWTKAFAADTWDMKLEYINRKAHVSGYPVWTATFVDKRTGQLHGAELWFGKRPSQKAVEAVMKKRPAKKHMGYALHENHFWMPYA